MGILSGIHCLGAAAAGILGHIPFGLLDCAHINTPNPADRCQIGMDRTGGITFFDQKISIILDVRLAIIKVPAFIINVH